MFGEAGRDADRSGLFVDEEAIEPALQDRLADDDAIDDVDDLDHDLGVSDHGDGAPVATNPARPPATPAPPSPAPSDSVPAASLDPTIDADDRPSPIDPVPDPGRIASAIQRLSEIGGDGRAMVSRLAFTEAEREAHALFADWLREAGFSPRVDAFGNTIGERPGGSDLPCLTLGSHLDSVPNGGRFDGVVGVVGALEVGRMFQESGIVTRHPLRLVAFANEEGARFGEACLGSKAVVGVIGPRDAERLRDANGVTLAQAMAALGLDARRIEDARWSDDEVAAYLELHIEQARLLEAHELAIGIVDAVAGNTRLRVAVHGRADHSGGTPMDWRQDALTGAAEMVLEVERIANEPARRATVATDYKATRVPWILPGFLAYRLFGPLAATYVLHLLVLIGGALAFWAGTRRLFGNGVALLATLLLMAYPGFHGSGITRFWNYHGQINLVYYLLGMLCLVFGARSRNPALWYLGAGAALAACLFTGLTYVLMAPAFGAFAIAVHPWTRPRRLLLMLGSGLVGAVLGTALFGAANALAGGPFLFFWRQVVYSFEWAGALAPRAPLDQWFPGWFKLAAWLGFPPLVALGSLAAIVPLARSSADRDQRWLAIGCWAQLLVAWGVLLLGEVYEQAMVEIAYQYQMILGSAAYALAALLWVGLKLDRRDLPRLGVLALVVGLVLPQILLQPDVRQQLRLALDPSQLLPILPSEYWGTALLLVAGGVLLVYAVRSRRALPIGVAGAVVGVAFAATAVAPDAYVPPDRCSYVANQFRVVQHLILWSSSERIDTRAMAWFDPKAERPRADGCPPTAMYPIFDAIQHGSNIRAAVNPVPERLSAADTDFLASAIRNRWSMVLLSTPEGTAHAEAELWAWLARSPVEGVARPRQRQEVIDGDVAVVFQVFELRRP